VIDGIVFIYVSIIAVCAFASVVNAEETARFVLLIILETVLITLFTEIFEPIVKIPLEFETLNLVFEPVT
jgi:hypothetical protein